MGEMSTRTKKTNKNNGDGTKPRRKKSKKGTNDMQRKRRGSAYGATSTSRRRSTSRPHSRPTIPDDVTREREQDEQEEQEEQEEEEEDPERDTLNSKHQHKKDRRGRKQNSRERQRSKNTALARPVRGSRGWHGEGEEDGCYNDSNENDNENDIYSGGEDINLLHKDIDHNNTKSKTTTKKGWDVPSDMSQDMEE